MNQNQTIITIGREYGSGGREIGEKLAAYRNIPCYDKEILKTASKNSGIAEQIFGEYDESAKNSLLYSLVMGVGMSSTLRDQPLTVKLYLEQFNTIKELAQKGSCVFIGRCSDYVLRDFDNIVNVFIHAPLKARIQRICQRNKTTPEKAAAMIEKTDKTRASYYHYNSNQKWGASKNYHLTLDSSVTGIEGAVKLIEEFINMKQSE